MLEEFPRVDACASHRGATSSRQGAIRTLRPFCEYRVSAACLIGRQLMPGENWGIWIAISLWSLYIVSVDELPQRLQSQITENVHTSIDTFMPRLLRMFFKSAAGMIDPSAFEFSLLEGYFFENINTKSLNCLIFFWSSSFTSSLVCSYPRFSFGMICSLSRAL